MGHRDRRLSKEGGTGSLQATELAASEAASARSQYRAGSEEALLPQQQFRGRQHRPPQRQQVRRAATSVYEVQEGPWAQQPCSAVCCHSPCPCKLCVPARADVAPWIELSVRRDSADQL
ncbi:hypothetical protein NDU88_002125 [Pleurodeles waltl]|uniref:Uncharacterized protein n=1 Tax=Pleurodeles waltl TaxID=8319 RepID=A0AAV7NGR4_PLEWA|nr:hypothetical protein NDU88_002125 [Pleurodeles waltl]